MKTIPKPSICFLQSLHLPKLEYFELPIKIHLIQYKNQKMRHPCGKPLLWYALLQKNATGYYHTTLAQLAAGSRLLDYLLKTFIIKKNSPL